jgi:hypothetical protein
MFFYKDLPEMMKTHGSMAIICERNQLFFSIAITAADSAAREFPAPEQASISVI